MREWYTSNELVELDGTPNTLEGISQKSKRNKWLRRKASGQGRAFEYHISNFHADVKKQLIERYITDPDEAKALMALEAPTKEDAPEPSNVSKIVPLAEVRDWCELPVFDVHAAAGAGSLVHSEYQIDKLIIPKSLLAEFGLAPNCAAIIYVDGNSMEPTLSHKDRLLVDTRELQHPVTDGVYVIRIDDAVYVKRLKWNIPKGIYQVISDNPTYESFEINHKNGRNFKIIGKAIAPVFKKIF
ncbi:phage repressor protein [Vibrio fluvialis]|uniref:Phage repressor protein n=2 Tax=Vibrio fluvialis TaxID=676 RepID=A0AAX2LY53_VIBFL|nr:MULTISPECIES: phage repressor protein [Vibrio]AMF92404.1 phage repressor protein [Vibrio fluvialis]EKO3401385.1 phage repressor protein [Vibrio fluvialis]EKO3466776.1 phage repressor protein [Vibrio fluvialis]EKO3478200.1 phage repressor protein [Vibrio fluvialis]EKO3915562.1 phage repressor protein [Vibrio fluvialis]